MRDDVVAYGGDLGDGLLVALHADRMRLQVRGSGSLPAGGAVPCAPWLVAVARLVQLGQFRIAPLRMLRRPWKSIAQQVSGAIA